VLTVATSGATPLLLGTTAGGVVLGLGAAACTIFGATAAGAAAVIAAVTLGFLPLLPLIATRVARVPVPSVPTGPDDLKADEENIDGPAIRRQSDRADGVLTALIGACAAIFLAAEIIFMIDGGVAALLFCALLGLILLIRARPYLGRSQRVPMIAVGSIGLGLTALGFFDASTPLIRLTAILGGLVVVAIIALVYGLAIAGKRIAPIWGRFLDIIEVILIVGAIPMAVWVSGIYAAVRGIKA
jgi:type VII secretion integral membrane protein EccD